MKLFSGVLDGLDFDRLGLWKWSGHKELIRYSARQGRKMPNPRNQLMRDAPGKRVHIHSSKASG